jgi:Zn-dependent peptidase ImmA (M78 family)
MTGGSQARPLKEAARITQMLDLVLGTDRFDRGPVDVERLALEYSANIAPQGPIHEVVARDLPGCVGALVYSETQPRQWGIVYHRNQSSGRRAFTIGHELGHYVLHRKLIEDSADYDGGIYCDENSIVHRNGSGLEKEADEFAAALLMPFHDFRKQLPPKQSPDFDGLGRIAKRYGVSLTATVLRWLEYTELKALMVVSNEGFAHWAKSSDAAFKAGRFIRTKGVVYELPSGAFASRKDYSDAAVRGAMQPAGVWFPEPVHEMCFRSERYDQEMTLLVLEGDAPQDQPEGEVPDVYDRFLASG